MRTTTDRINSRSNEIKTKLIEEGVIVRWDGPRAWPLNAHGRVRSAADGCRQGWTVVLLEAGDAHSYSEWCDVHPDHLNDPRVVKYLEYHGVKTPIPAPQIPYRY